MFVANNKTTKKLKDKALIAALLLYLSYKTHGFYFLNGRNDMDILEFLKSRRAVRHFTAKKIHDEEIEKVLEAGRYAPSPLNSQPWNFTLVRNKSSLSRLASTARHGSFLSEAQLLIIVSVNKEVTMDDWLIQHNQHIYSGVAAMQNMWLEASSLSIGCCWVTIDKLTAKEVISLPDSQELLGGLALGGMDETVINPHDEKDRKPLSTIISIEKFGDKENCEFESCCGCLKLVPKSAANSFEGKDYIRYFCGKDCYVQWQKQTDKWLNNKNDKD